LFGIIKFEKVGVAIFIVKFVLIDAEENPNVADCVAVIVALPAFSIVTVSPLIEINCDPEESVVNVYVANTLVFVEVGFDRVNGIDPKTRGATTKLDNIGTCNVPIYVYIMVIL
jgi:hypothetical protein